MGTFMFKNKLSKCTPVSNVFIEKYMPKARGEFIKVYLLGLKYCISGELGINLSMIADTLNLLETDVMNAFYYWNEQKVINFIPIDNANNFSVEFIELNNNINEDCNEENGKIDILKELNNTRVNEMLHDIEKLLGRSLSPNEMTMYLSWQQDYSFSPEIILLLIQYCTSKGKTNYRYIETIAIDWFENNIKTIDDAQKYIKSHEDKWIKIRKILTYLGMQTSDVMKPQESMIDKWLNTYKFSLDIIYKACDICFERINKADFKYIDGILKSWFKDGIKSLEDIDKKETNKTNLYKKKTNYGNKKLAFTNYKQRNYNYDELEKKLLGWDKND